MPKRRAHGEGTLYQRPDGLWCAQLTLPDGRRKTKYDRAQKAVREWLQGQQALVAAGTWSGDDRVTFGVFLERFLADVVAHQLRQSTHESYSTLARVHLAPTLGAKRLSALRPVDFQQLYSAKLEAGYSRRTVEYIHAVAHRALAQAVKWGVLARNVADAVDVPHPVQKLPAMLTLEQVQALLVSVEGMPLHALVMVALTTGMRKSELIGLRWVDVNLEAGTLLVSQVGVAVKGGMSVTEPKTPASRRVVELALVTVQALQAHRERQADLASSSSRWRNNGLVFPSSVGTPQHSRSVLGAFHKALKRAGLPRVNFHSLRHLHSTLLLAANVNPKVVQARLGHSRISMTLDTYSHMLPGMQQPAADEMDDLFTA